MKKIFFVIGAVFALGLLLIIGARILTGEDTWICQNGAWVKHGNPSSPQPTKQCENNKNMEVKMQITSSAFQNNAAIPVKYTCDGERVSPALAFSDIPAETKSLALIMADPDAPSGEFVHWVVFNLPPDTTTIAEDQTPAGVIGKNSGNQNNYFPPCPPSGQHHYIFKVYALDTMLNLDANASKKDVEVAIKNHILASAELIGLYR